MSSEHRMTCLVVACAAVLALLWPIAIFVLHHPALSSAALRANAIVFILLWALGPAIWFIVEWRFWRYEAGLARGQQYARDFWLGAGAVVLLFAAQALTPWQAAPASHSVISWKLVVKVIQAGLWPLVVVIGFVLFRDSIAACLSAIGMRASKIASPFFSIELASLPVARPWSGPGLDELRAGFAFEALDSSGSLIRAIEDATPVDYVTVDLGDGKAWLSSRLFILAALIPRVRPIQRIVFVRDPAKLFLGECPPTSLAQALAEKYPELKKKYIVSNTSAPLFGPVAPNEARQVLEQFLHAIRKGWEEGNPDWTDLGKYHEYAVWVSDSSLVELLGRRLNTIAVKRDLSEDSRVAARILLRQREDYVAVVDVDGGFLRLVDRRKAIDQVVRRELAHTP